MRVKQTLNKLAVGSALLAAAAFTGAGLAQADGMPGKRVVYEKPWNWSGLYFGLHSGWASADIDSAFVNAAGVPTGFSDSVTHSTPVVGGQIGLQHQFGNIVLGVEGALTSSFGDRYTSADVDCPNPARICTKQFDNVLTVGARLGWAAGHWMPYLAGGYASARFSHESYDKAPFPSGQNTIIGSERTNGWYIGGGVDWMVARNWTVGLEYRHYEFNDTFMPTFVLATGASSGEFRNLDPSVDAVTLRVSWKFDRPDRVAPLK